MTLKHCIYMSARQIRLSLLCQLIIIHYFQKRKL